MRVATCALLQPQVRTEEELAEAFSYARNEGADKLCFIECLVHRWVLFSSSSD